MAKKNKIPEYQVWLDMRQRCLNPNHQLYPGYGGRGITICTQWDSFETFLVDMGRRPGKKREYTLERIDNNKGYSLDNCKWVTWKEQGQNRRPRCSSPLGEANGQSKLTNEQVKIIRTSECPVSLLAERFGVCLSTIYRILSKDHWAHV